MLANAVSWYIYDLVINYWWIAVAYVILYAISATIFLLTLRIKSEDGSLTVNRDSLAYLIAYPMYRHTKANKEWRLERLPNQGSICKFFIRMFHMLFLIWPFLVIYFAGVLTIGNVIGIMVFGQYVTLDLTEDGFWQAHDIYIGRRRLIPLMVPAFGLLLLGLVIFKFSFLLKILGALAFGILCISPILIAVAAIVGGIIYVALTDEAHGSAKVFVAKEFLASKKEKFCKMINFN
jgi:hypothetical protein